jgi:outer membrane protein TolC
LDPLAEIQAALDNRSELKEARLQVDNARILRSVAKNRLLPRFDVVFRYAVDGLGASAHDALSEVSKNDFHEYLVMIEFEYPIGNRAAEAAFRRARLQQSQAEAGVQAAIEQIILEVNVAMRAMLTNRDRVEPDLASADAAEEDVKARVARQERKDPLTLESELNARQTLARARQSLLQTLVDYSTAIIELERAKGTLLEYNNIVLEEGPRYRP